MCTLAITGKLLCEISWLLLSNKLVQDHRSLPSYKKSYCSVPTLSNKVMEAKNAARLRVQRKARKGTVFGSKTYRMYWFKLVCPECLQIIKIQMKEANKLEQVFICKI